MYRFTLYLTAAEISDEDADRLYEAGCDDGTPCSRDGRAFIGFGREAQSLEDAIRSAVGNVKKAGYNVTHVEIDGDDIDEMAAASTAAGEEMMR